MLTKGASEQNFSKFNFIAAESAFIVCLKSNINYTKVKPRTRRFQLTLAQRVTLEVAVYCRHKWQRSFWLMTRFVLSFHKLSIGFQSSLQNLPLDLNTSVVIMIPIKKEEITSSNLTMWTWGYINYLLFIDVKHLRLFVRCPKILKYLLFFTSNMCPKWFEKFNIVNTALPMYLYFLVIDK